MLAKTALPKSPTWAVLLAAIAALGIFVPSGGGKWILEAPYVMAGANAWHVHLGWTVQIYNAAEALPNLMNPFWMLPLMGILKVRARDLAGYSILAAVLIDGHRPQADAVRDFIAAHSSK